MGFHDIKSEVKAIISDVRDLPKASVRETLRDEKGVFQQDLATIEEIVDTESFIVGVVGVFNTGKSMLLNALMRKNVLDYHILPETAAITSLKFGGKRNGQPFIIGVLSSGVR